MLCLFFAPKILASQVSQVAGSTPVAVVVTIPKVTEIKVNPYSTSSIREYIKKEFPDAPIMVDVASCESRFRQFKSDGSIYLGKENPLDTGVFQINQYYHLEESKKLGMDIFTLEGNVAFARILYDRNGTRDWNWSKFMWSNGECDS